MATARVAPSPRGPEAAEGAPWPAHSAARLPVPREATALGVALLVLLAWAAFAHGSIYTSNAAPLEVGVALVAALGVAALLFGRLRARTTPAGVAALALFAGLAAWSGVSLAWSVAPDDTWTTFNRELAYAAVLALAVVFGSSHPGARDRAAGGGLVLALLVALYALGSKVVPGLHVGPLDLDQPSPRLRAPLDYWNALALVCAFGVLLALRAAVDETRSLSRRLGSLAALAVFLVTLGLTYSRGALVALGLGLLVSVGLGGARLRSLLMLGMAGLACVAPLAVAFTRHDLADVVPLADRTDGGVVLGAVLLGALAVLLAAGWAVLRRERRTPPDPRRSRRLASMLLACLGIALVGFLGRVALSDGGIPGAVDRAVSHFTHVRETSAFAPQRVLSLSSGNRWEWWQEAWGAGLDRPVGGWGAGSFPTVHQLYRRKLLEVRSAHSGPMQLWAETGMVGVVLGGGALAALLWAALSGVRRAPRRRERALAAALLGVGVTWAVQGLADWVADVPGVTLGALAALGVVVGSGLPAVRAHLGQRGVGARSLALAAVTLVCVACALSALLPALAAREAVSAGLEAATRPRSTGDALQRAELAARLDPLGTDGLLAAAAILERDHPAAARARLLDAGERDPYDGAVWGSLIGVTHDLGDLRGYRRAQRGLRESDPLQARGLLVDPTQTLIAPPRDSATASPTPLPPA